MSMTVKVSVNANANTPRDTLKKLFIDILINNNEKMTSANTYANNALRMVEELYKDFSLFKLTDLETDFDKISDYIMELPLASGKQKAITAGVNSIVKALDIDDAIKENYSKLFEVTKEKDSLYRLEKTWAFDDDPVVLWKQIKDRAAAIPEIDVNDVDVTTGKNLRNFMTKYIAMLYTLHPPIRHGEWIASVFLDKDDGKTNHVNLEKGDLTVYEQKSLRFTKKHNKLSPDLVKYMKDVKTIMQKLWPNQKTYYVLPKYEKGGYGPPDPSTISQRIEAVLGQNLNSIRKIYEGVVYKNGSSDTYLYVVNALGHTADTSRKDYLTSLRKDTDKPVWPTHNDHFAILEEYMHSGKKLKPQTSVTGATNTSAVSNTASTTNASSTNITDTTTKKQEQIIKPVLKPVTKPKQEIKVELPNLKNQRSTVTTVTTVTTAQVGGTKDNQCNALTKQHNRCKNKCVKAQDVCHQHLKFN